MNKHNLISIFLPVFSIIIALSAVYFLQPGTTGLVIYEPNQTQKLVNADVTLTTKSSEIIPPNAIIQIEIDNKEASMPIADFIKKTGQDYEIKEGNLTEFGYSGPGFTGNYNYSLTLANFNLDRNIAKGEHVFKTRILYRGQLLYEKENRIMISE